jgi:hypothetical protein
MTDVRIAVQDFFPCEEIRDNDGVTTPMRGNCRRGFVT